MSYQSFKRVLGETSLERKCRILFGVSLLILISGAFWYAGYTAEGLVQKGPRRTGKYFVHEKLQSYHLVRGWDPDDAKAEIVRQSAQMLSESLGADDFQWQVLVLGDEFLEEKLDEETKGFPKRTFLAEGRERELLLELRDEVDQLFEAYGRERLHTSGEGSEKNDELVMAAIKDPTSPFTNPVARLDTVDGNYHYYQPILWRPFCSAGCHVGVADRVNRRSRYSYSTQEWTDLGKPEVLRVMKVVIPREKTENEIMRTRAILSATAIATVFLSMLALYAVVRYVIVKPLNHLREVSDEIGRGNYDLRASIQTGDEFEELAASFNRMLRHLVDTQAELRLVNKDSDAKVDQLARANMQLHEMNRVKSDFLASMSHELRTPLNSIIGFADVLKENDNLNEKQKRYTANIGSSGRALLEMINDILDLAKAESGKMEVRLTEFEIDTVVNAQCDLVRSLSEEKNIDLVAVVPSDLPPLYQDQGKIQQILINLLSNAIKFTPEGGRITVTAERDPMRHLVVTVEDTGVGIAEEERRVIFEKFRQGTQTVGTDHLTREFTGSGLGLSIVKELCKLLGGEISFESELGKGSTFCVRVPWTLADQPRLDTSISQRLDEVTKGRSLEWGGPNHSGVEDQKVNQES